MFVVKNGYEGPIVLILLEEATTAFIKEDGRNVYKIPRSGTLCVRSFRNFTHGWGTTKAIYENGSEIPQATPGNFDDRRFDVLLQKWSSSRSDASGITELMSDPEILFFIGNSEEMSAYRVAWAAEEPSYKRHLCESK